MRNQHTKILVEGAAMVALATILSMIQVFKLPWGGTVTLLSMLPIALFSIKYGVRKGLSVSFVFSIIQFVLGATFDGLFGWGLTVKALIACILLDYISAYTLLGFSGMFRNKGMAGWITGTVIAVFFRFICHFISGVFIFHSFGELWSGFSTENIYLYSLLYNGCYMLPEMIFTGIGAFVLFKVPQTKKLLITAEA
ncbi:MAG: energy-coupled thiamine transporter ThiT [Oscillospiraceae bacterium]|nr:energy-coupled thiamine transporter ThiT [Oscillospiraceae bacterium]